MNRVVTIAAVVVTAALAAGCSGSAAPTQQTGADSTSATSAVPPMITLPAIDVAQLDSMIRRTVASKHLVGLNAGVAANGKIILAKGYGLRTLGGRDSVTPETMFAIGSVTKQFTCSSVLTLAHDGKLSMSDPVAKYFPDLTRASDVTLLDLGNHVSGYRDYYPLDYVDREMQHDQSPDSIIDEYAKRPLDFDPDTHWSYSNTNFLILGRVVEKVGGQSFGSFLSQHFFTPLGMQHTAYDPPHGAPGEATGYTSFALGSPIPAAPEGRGWAGMAGAIWSTPTDLMTWDLGLVDGKVLSPEGYHTLTTPRHLKDGRSTGYGCGEDVRETGPAIILEHGGAVSGFVAENIVIPATRSAIVMLANTDFASLGALDDSIIRELLPHPDVPTINGPPAVDAARTFLTALQQGHVDRSTLSDDYSAYLTPALVAGAHVSLHPISAVEVTQTRERGGMEVAQIRFKTGSEVERAVMYRSPDGKIQEVLFQRQ